MRRCCENCVNFHYNNQAQCGTCNLFIRHGDGVEQCYRTTMFGNTIKEHICQFYKRKEVLK